MMNRVAICVVSSAKSVREDCSGSLVSEYCQW